MLRKKLGKDSGKPATPVPTTEKAVPAAQKNPSITTTQGISAAKISQVFLAKESKYDWIAQGSRRKRNRL